MVWGHLHLPCRFASREMKTPPIPFSQCSTHLDFLFFGISFFLQNSSRFFEDFQQIFRILVHFLQIFCRFFCRILVDFLQISLQNSSRFFVEFQQNSSRIFVEFMQNFCTNFKMSKRSKWVNQLNLIVFSCFLLSQPLSLRGVV